MRASSAALAVSANPGPEQLFTRFGTTVRPIDAVMRKLHELYPEKTAANIAARTGVTSRAAEYWRAGERDMSATAFIALLASDDGFAILEAALSAIPKKQRPAWWARQVNVARLATIERAQAEQEEEIRQLRLELTARK